MALRTYTTSANDGAWDTIANWGGVAPTDGDSVVIAGAHPPTVGPQGAVVLFSMDTTGCTVAFDPAGDVTTKITIDGGALKIGRTGVTGNHWAGNASASVGSIYWNTALDGTGGNGFVANGDTSSSFSTSGSTFNDTSVSSGLSVGCTFNGSSSSTGSVGGTTTYNGASGPISGSLSGTIHWYSSAILPYADVDTSGVAALHVHENLTFNFNTLAAPIVDAGKHVTFDFGNFTVVYPTPGGGGGTSRLSLSL